MEVKELSVFDPRARREERRIARATGGVLVLVGVLFFRAIFAGGSAGGLAGALVGIGALSLAVLSLARLDRACAQPFAAEAKLIALAAVFPWFWLDLGQPVPGLASAALGVSLVGLAIGRRRGDVAAGIALGAASGLAPSLAVVLAWLLYRLRWRMLAGFAAGFGGVLLLGWLAGFVRAATEPGAPALVAGLFPASSPTLVHAIWGGLSAAVIACVLVWSWVKHPGLRVGLGPNEVAGAFTASALLAPWAGPPLGVLLVAPFALAFEAARESEGRAARRIAGLALAGAALAGWASFLAPLLPASSANGALYAAALRTLAAAALLVPVTHPAFHPTVRRA